jgi:hypothetical protein
LWNCDERKGRRAFPANGMSDDCAQLCGSIVQPRDHVPKRLVRDAREGYPHEQLCAASHRFNRIDIDIAENIVIAFAGQRKHQRPLYLLAKLLSFAVLARVE